jgi:UDP-GlcNAc:undecaprenyl-phosphate/decaprenyl-phosphate GlcNAc-1-phosphate transferase
VDVSDFVEPVVQSLLKYAILLAVSYFLVLLVFPYLVTLLKETGLVKPNYRDEKIPASAGLIFVVTLPLTTVLGMLLSIKSFTVVNSFLFLFVVFGMGFMGLLDDYSSNTKTKGFKGHLRALFKEKRLTSGGFKAIFGAVIALVFSLGTSSVQNGWFGWSVLINFLLVSLTANTINLFDLRPGRAGKIYLVGFVLIAAFSKHFENIGLFLPIMVVIIYYLPWDLQAKVMMGDIGSNLLGASLGVMMAWMFSDLGKVAALVVLIILQLAAERYSFTEVFLKFGWLNYLDDLGRRKN